MPDAAAALAALGFLFWIYQGSELVWGASQIPMLKVPKELPAKFPKVSILFTARNEELRVGSALGSMLALDYPDFEVIAVSDRSTDATESILRSFENNPRLKVLAITSLPAGWIGKNHALYSAYQKASGEYLLFTDADVHFEPLALKAAVGEMLREKIDHTALFPKLVYGGGADGVFASCFGVAFLRRFKPWAAKNPRSSAFVGIGAFNLVRREAYEKMGTHEALRYQIVDDMLLGKLVKKAGFRQAAYSAQDLVSVRWFEGWHGLVRSIEKNAFGGVGYRLSMLFIVITAFLLFDILPFGLLFVPGPARILAAGALLFMLASYFAARRPFSTAPALFPFHAFGNLLVLALLARSAFLALVNGGIVWRGTFYPLAELREKQISL